MPTPSREEKKKICQYCDGDGKIRHYLSDENGIGIGVSQSDCLKCKRTGTIVNKQ